jgi:hypothetical protein
LHLIGRKSNGREEMCRKIIVSLCLIICPVLAVNTQGRDSDTDLRIGLGFSTLKQGNVFLVLSEYELDAKLSDYFTVAPSIVLNVVDKWKSDSEKLFQANMNVFLSPFRNNRRNDFRIGSGLSFYKFNQPVIRSAFGFNLIVEDSYSINDRFFIGVKAFMQPYFNRESSSGVLLKAGINL